MIKVGLNIGNSKISCTVSEITSGGIEVEINENVKGFIKKSDLSSQSDKKANSQFLD